MGISTSCVPTVYGPVYEGNEGVGLRNENRDMAKYKFFSFVCE